MTQNRPNDRAGRSGEGKRPPRQKRGFRLAGLPVFLALVLLLAAMLLLRWRSDSPDAIRQEMESSVSEDEIRTFGGVYMALSNLNESLLNAAR